MQMPGSPRVRLPAVVSPVFTLFSACLSDVCCDDSVREDTCALESAESL